MISRKAMEVLRTMGRATAVIREIEGKPRLMGNYHYSTGCTEPVIVGEVDKRVGKDTVDELVESGLISPRIYKNGNVTHSIRKAGLLLLVESDCRTFKKQSLKQLT
jgi:hypothetical protein